jgi:hypothetical protein
MGQKQVKIQHKKIQAKTKTTICVHENSRSDRDPIVFNKGEPNPNPDPNTDTDPGVSVLHEF